MTVETQTWPDKYTSERFPVGANWAPLLGEDDTIATCNAVVEQGNVIIDTPSPVNNFTDAIQTVWVDGGTEGACVVLCTITTTNGREFAQRYRFNIIP